MRIYTEEPTTAAARAAWRYFIAKYPKRRIRQINYCAGGQYEGENGWAAHFEVPEGPVSAAYVYDYSAMTSKFAPSREIKDYWS